MTTVGSVQGNLARTTRPSGGAKHVFAGAFWITLYLALTLAPLILVFITAGPAGRSFWIEFSVALGFIGLAMMGLQFVLTARFKLLKAPYGSDIIYTFHRSISIISFLLILAHPVILFITRWDVMKSRPFTHPAPFWTGTASVLCLLFLIAVSIWRGRLKLEYDSWRRMHAILGVGALALATVHVLFIGHYLDTPAQRVFWLIYTLMWLGLILWVRLIKPVIELRTPYAVHSVTPERGNAHRLTIRPVNHAGLRFQPGQFAWITVGASPFSDREHPFSFSGSAERAASTGELEFTIKELGDFTRRIKDVKPGDTVYVDGPFGALSADRHPHADGFVFIAGGIGITPMVSHLATFADRGETRPLYLFYANNTLEAAPLRDRVDELARRLPHLVVVDVLASPPDAWRGERGFLTADIFRKHLPAHCFPPSPGGRFEYFICGPQPMMDAVEKALYSLNVPVGDFHSERFNLV